MNTLTSKAPAPALKRALVDCKTPFAFPPSREKRIAAIFGGLYTERFEGVVRPVRRVLDFGAGCGEFAVWAWKRWQGPWIDMTENDPELAALASTNAPPGARLLPHGTRIDADVYDVVRVTCELEAILPMLANVPIVIVDVTDIRGGRS